MELVVRKVNPHDSDYALLIAELNHKLGLLTGDSGETSFNAEDYDCAKDSIIVAYIGERPVGTGSIRFISSKVCEIKRMYSKKRGVGKHLISKLENNAKSLGYSEIILSTRRVNKKAINFYRSQQYLEIKAYGKHVGVERSICMSKRLTPQQ